MRAIYKWAEVEEAVRGTGEGEVVKAPRKEGETEKKQNYGAQLTYITVYTYIVYRNGGKNVDTGDGVM